MTRRKSLAINILLVVASSTLALVMAELIFMRMESPEIRQAFLKRERGSFNKYYNPVLGWMNASSEERVAKRKEFKVTISNNAHGMRDEEVGPKKGFRVAVLGDSFAWGWGVEAKERFTEIIEEELGVDMLNFAVSGYGLTHYYLQLDKVLEFKPDMVLITICLSNDFQEALSNYNHRHYHPYAALEDGKLVIKGLPVPDIRRLGEETVPPLIQFAIGRFLYLHVPALWRSWFDIPHYSLALPPEGISDYRIYQEPENEELRQGTPIIEALLTAIKHKLEAEGITLVAYTAFTKKDVTIPTAYNRVKEALERVGIPVITPREAFIKEDYFGDDGHWNVKGQRKAANDILPVIRERAREAVK